LTLAVKPQVSDNSGKSQQQKPLLLRISSAGTYPVRQHHHITAGTKWYFLVALCNM